jgi:hypothetical protein
MVFPMAARAHPFLWSCEVLFLYCFIEPVYFSFFGTTLGKALLSIDVRTKEGGHLSYNQATQRTVNEWFYGAGCGVPIVSLVTMLISFNKLTNDGITKWDKEGDFQVVHRKIGPWCAALATLILLGLLVTAVMLIDWSKLPK